MLLTTSSSFILHPSSFILPSYELNLLHPLSNTPILVYVVYPLQRRVFGAQYGILSS